MLNYMKLLFKHEFTDTVHVKITSNFVIIYEKMMVILHSPVIILLLWQGWYSCH